MLRSSDGVHECVKAPGHLTGQVGASEEGGLRQAIGPDQKF